jgi:hypothetical protein
MSAGSVAAARPKDHRAGGGATPTPALQQLVVKPVPILLAKKLRTPVEPVPPDTEHLLAWASEIAQQDLVLPMPVRYLEAPLRTVTTHRVSYYANLYLREISYARLQQRTGGWGRFTSEWFKEQERGAIQALAALREAIQTQVDQEANS